MTVAPRTRAYDEAISQIRTARAKQLAARIAWARSPNSSTIFDTCLADRQVDIALDRLLLAMRQP